MSELLRRFTATLLQTERLPPETMRRYQERLLVQLVRHATAHVPFYRDTGRLAGVVRDDGTIDWERWAAVPVLTRADAQAHADQLVAETLGPEHGEVSTASTSGSTGQPFVHRRSVLQRTAGSAVSERFIRWWGFDRDATYAVVKSNRKSDDIEPREIGGWGIDRRGRMVAADPRWSVDRLATWLDEVRPRYLETFPNLAALVLERLGERVKAWPLDSFIGIGECLGEDAAAAWRARGVRPLATYSAMEVGLIATQCPHCGGHHVASELQYFETLPAEARGDIGRRAIVTPLYGYAMPLVRYDVGDLVELAEADDCPVRLPRLSRVLGRVRQPFVCRDGSRRWLPLRSYDLRKIVPFRRLQVVQTAIGVVELRLECDGPPPAPDPQALDAMVSSWMREPTRVDLKIVPTLPAGPTGKFQEVFSLIA